MFGLTPFLSPMQIVLFVGMADQDTVNSHNQSYSW